MINTIVIFGGQSAEHDISIITGLQLISKCNKDKYNIIPIYITKTGEWLTGDELLDIDNYNLSNFKKVKKCLLTNYGDLCVGSVKKYKKYLKVDTAILCLHGANGEDGSVAGLMQLYNIPYTAASICSSSVCLDKGIFKTFCKGLGVNIIDGFVIEKNEYIIDKDICMQKIQELGYPVIIKPCRQGSSIGIEVCDEEQDISEKINKAFKYDSKLLIEKFVNVKKEVNIAILNDKGSLVISQTEEPISNNKFLNFEDKYMADGFEGIKRVVPASITKKQHTEILNTAKLVYESLEMFGVVRFDFIIDNEDNIYLNEVNTIPGSMANYLFDKSTMTYDVLIDKLVSNAIFRLNIHKNNQVEYLSGVLSSGNKGFKK